MMKLKETNVYILDGDQGSSLFSVFISIDYNFYYGQKLSQIYGTNQTYADAGNIFIPEYMCLYIAKPRSSPEKSMLHMWKILLKS